MPKSTKRTGKSGALSTRTRARLDRKRETAEQRAVLHEGQKAERASRRRQAQSPKTAKALKPRIRRLAKHRSAAGLDALAEIVRSTNLPPQMRVEAARTILEIASPTRDKPNG